MINSFNSYFYPPTINVTSTVATRNVDGSTHWNLSDEEILSLDTLDFSNIIICENLTKLASLISSSTAVTKLNLDFYDPLSYIHNDMLNEDDLTILINDGLSQNTSIRSLSLRGNYLSNKGVVKIANFLEQNPSLTQLNLSNNFIKSKGIKKLAESLMVNTNLQVLSLGSNEHIGLGSDNLFIEDASNAFMEALRYNTTLTALCLGSIPYFPIRWDCIASNNTLTHLDLSGTLLGDGTLEIANVLRTNSSITVLNLGLGQTSTNLINEAELTLLSESLTENFTLTHLDLSGNFLGPRAGTILEGALKFNTSLISLDLDYVEPPVGDFNLKLLPLLERNAWNIAAKRVTLSSLLLPLLLDPETTEQGNKRQLTMISSSSSSITESNSKRMRR